MMAHYIKKSRYELKNHPYYYGQLLKLPLKICISYLFFFLCIITMSAKSQPSGGPYGPIHQKYNLPKVTGKIYFVAVDGQSGQSGETLANPTTLESAIEKVNTGDAIILKGGIYRTGNLFLNQGITIQPYTDEQPVLKGTFIAENWNNLKNGLWTTKWSHLFPSKPDAGSFFHFVGSSPPFATCFAFSANKAQLGIRNNGETSSKSQMLVKRKPLAFPLRVLS